MFKANERLLFGDVRRSTKQGCWSSRASLLQITCPAMTSIANGRDARRGLVASTRRLRKLLAQDNCPSFVPTELLVHSDVVYLPPWSIQTSLSCTPTEPPEIAGMLLVGRNELPLCQHCYKTANGSLATLVASELRMSASI